MAPPRYLFLDTQFFYRHKYDFEHVSLTGLMTHGEQGRMRLVLPRVIEREIRSHLAERAHRFARWAHENPLLRNSRTSVVVAVRGALTAPILEREFSETLDRFLTVCDVVRLDTDEIPVSRIQEDYVAKRPPFGGSNPKAQFPDGFAITAMRDWLEEDGKGESIAVITEDVQMNAACKAQGAFVLYKELSEYLLELQAVAGAEDEQTVTKRLIARMEPHVRTAVWKLRDLVEDKAAQAFEWRGFWLEDEDGDVDGVKVSEIVPDYQGVEILAISEGYALVSVRADVKFEARLSYLDSSTGSWDSEDHRLLFQERRNETREYEQEDEFLVELHFRGVDADSIELSRVQVEGDVGLSVEDGSQAGD
jgi:hypothetical protein